MAAALLLGYVEKYANRSVVTHVIDTQVVDGRRRYVPACGTRADSDAMTVWDDDMRGARRSVTCARCLRRMGPA